MLPFTILRYKSGDIVPSDESLEKIAKCLQFPKEFFAGAEVDEPRRDNASFRGMADKSARIMDAALASGAIAFMLDDWIAKTYNRPNRTFRICMALTHIPPPRFCASTGV